MGVILLVKRLEDLSIEGLSLLILVLPIEEGLLMVDEGSLVIIMAFKGLI